MKKLLLISLILSLGCTSINTEDDLIIEPNKFNVLFETTEGGSIRGLLINPNTNVFDLNTLETGTYFTSTIIYILNEYTFVEGTLINLIAVPNDGYAFVSWEGIDSDDINRSNGGLDLLLNSNQTIRAVFEKIETECTYNGQTDSGETITGTWVAPLLDDFLINTSVNGRNGRLEILPEGISDNSYEYKWEFQPEGSEEIIEINNNSNLLIPSTAQEIPSNISTTGLYTVYVYERGNTEGCAPFRAQISITLQVSTYVPDDNFEQYLIDSGYDDVLDDYVLTENITGIEELNMVEKNISDLTGIEDFESLKDLDLLRNSLTEVDLTSNSNIENLHLGQNQITEIDLTQNTKLKNFSIGDNLLTEIDVSNNPELTSLVLGSPPKPIATNLNRIQELDLSNNNKIVYLNLSNNNILGTIDLSNLTELMVLVIDGNSFLESLDLSNNPKIEWLSIGYTNYLSSIDISNQSILKLFSIRASSQFLNSLDISNNNELIVFDATFSSLDCITVSQYQLDNQINNKKIGNQTSEFIVPLYRDEQGNLTAWQPEESIRWTKDSDTIYSTNCD